ncbi:MAG TPA: oxygenase MpaB family protein [Vicinamibacterales bacterium]|nr:oxygenase MpaB family protein [Vicinamibacterales bacterium]
MIAERINRERLVLLGWSRAILMQIAHPLVAAGVIQHSSFRGGVFQAAARLHHTVSAMLSLTFGDDERRASAIARIRTIHTMVNGTLAAGVGPFPAGTRYSAEDPALLLWVHATLLDSTADIYQRLVAPLTADELNLLCIEGAPLLHALGGDPATTPRSWQALQRYIRTVSESGVLAVTPDARALGAAVLTPRAAGLAVPLGGLHQLVTVGLLPAALRTQYGFEWSPARARRFDRTVRVLRAIRRVTPGVAAHWRVARRAHG